MTTVQVHAGWQDDIVRVQDARRVFTRTIRRRLQVSGMPLLRALPSEQRVAAGIEAASYYSYPLLFYPYFPDVSLEQLRGLSVCGSYLFDYTLCLDTLLDRSASGDVGALLVSGMLQSEALSALHALFPPGTAFWRHFEAFTDHFTQAVLRERACHHCLVTPYSEAALQFIYSGKAAIAKGCIAAMASLGSRADLIERLVASHDAFYVAFQLLDDLQDWRVDYRRQHYSYPLTRAFSLAGWEAKVESEDRPEPEDVQALIEKTGLVEEVRALVATYLDRAAAPLAGLPPSTWAAAIERTRQHGARAALAPSPAPPPSAAEVGAPLDWKASPVPAPVAPSWLGWLVPARRPRIDDERIREAQRTMLSRAKGTASLGEALCQVGLAIGASRQSIPGGLGAHLGMAAGELEWCRRNDQWLYAVLAASLDEAPLLWAPETSAAIGDASGWMPPAVGRYLGYRLVESYSSDSGRGRPLVEMPAAAILDHYRRQTVA